MAGGSIISTARNPRKVILVNGKLVDVDEFRARCEALRDQGYKDVCFRPNRAERRKGGEQPKFIEPRVFVRTGADPNETRRVRNRRKARRRKERG